MPGWAAARSETPLQPPSRGQGYDGDVISTSAVDAYVEKHSRRFVDELKELCSFPSISNHGRDAIQPARDWLADRLAKFTDRGEKLEAGGGPPPYPQGPRAGRRKLLLFPHLDGPTCSSDAAAWSTSPWGSSCWTSTSTRASRPSIRRLPCTSSARWRACATRT